MEAVGRESCGRGSVQVHPLQIRGISNSAARAKSDFRCSSDLPTSLDAGPLVSDHLSKTHCLRARAGRHVIQRGSVANRSSSCGSPATWTRSAAVSQPSASGTE